MDNIIIEYKETSRTQNITLFCKSSGLFYIVIISLYFVTKSLYFKRMGAHMCSPVLVGIWVWHLNDHVHLITHQYFSWITLWVEHASSKWYTSSSTLFSLHIFMPRWWCHDSTSTPKLCVQIWRNVKAFRGSRLTYESILRM